jgi:phosphatidylcholine synthase
MPWLVHAFTASGALLAYLAVIDIVAGDLRRAFLWLTVATLVDSVDGVLARLANVKERTPMLNGARLDDIVDYLTFVFVPAFALHHGGFLPAGLAGWLVVSAVLLSSAFGFSREDAKTADYFFTGFPSYWNIVAVYMVALALPAALNAGILLALAASVFVPIGYVYPSRTPRLRGLTVGFGIVWGLVLIAIIWRLPDAPRWLVLTSLAYPAYYVGLSLLLQRSRASASATKTQRHSPQRL